MRGRVGANLLLVDVQEAGAQSDRRSEPVKHELGDGWGQRGNKALGPMCEAGGCLK